MHKLRDLRPQRLRNAALAFSILALTAGGVGTALLVYHYGFKVIADALVAVGMAGFAAVTAFHLGIVTACGVAWFVLVPQPDRPSPWAFILGRMVRNGASEALPLSQAGGFIMGARAATAAGLPGAMSVASTVVDITMELLGELIFVGIALAILARLHPGTALEGWVATGLVGATAVATVYAMAQRRGFTLIERVANRAPQGAGLAAGAATLQGCIDHIYGRLRGPVLGFLMHLTCWLASAVEAWFALGLMGAAPGFAVVLSIEGLVTGARALAFAVPGALGVQEAAHVFVGAMFGVSADALLALSLLKRARDLVLGLPPVVAWQFLEGNLFWHNRSAPREDTSDTRDTSQAAAALADDHRHRIV
jgi:putative membrane protein